MSIRRIVSDRLGISPEGSDRSGACAGGWISNTSLELSELVNSTRRSSSSASARFNTSPEAGLPCQPPPWMLGQPQPFTVLATTAIGWESAWADRSANSSNAFLICFGSCPSIVRTWNPDASNFDAVRSADC
ncbi:MAG: hypothetical protein IPJ41_01140 [Phycisphaerales bacterium]|nr:hypothetical protein [Phycisphaerales bacterium]